MSNEESRNGIEKKFKGKQIKSVNSGKQQQ